MRRRGKLLLRSILSYLVASVACLIYIQWPDFAGHVHLPFSSFPSSLVLAPFSPWMAVWMLTVQPLEAVLALAVFGAVFALVFSVSARRRASARE
jgi:hypothetical protein